MADDARTPPADSGELQPTQKLARDLLGAGPDRASREPGVSPTAPPAPVAHGVPRPDAPTLPLKEGAWAWPNVPQRLGPYALVDELGHGGMGIVFRARHVKLENDCAVKVLIAGEHASPEAIARFQREAAAVAKMGKHPNIVTVHDLGQEGSLSYYAMELVQGVSLRRKIREESYKPKEAAALVEKVARALDFAHEHGVIHRDMKPDNVVVRADGEPQVMDFGLARDLGSEAQLSATGQVMGTPAYMAPEQARGEASKTDARTDVYALGAILYELLTGIPPHGGQDLGAIFSKILRGDIVPPRKLRPEVPRDIETVSLKCMELSPALRYQTADALADDLARFTRGEPVLARPVGPVERLWRKGRRHRRIVAPVAMLAVVALFALGWAVTGALRKAEDVASALRKGRDAEGAGSLEVAREAYKTAATLEQSCEEANAGLSRVEGQLKAQADARAAEEQDAERLLAHGGRALDLAQDYLYDPKASYEEIRKRIEAGKKLIEEAIAKAPHRTRGHDLLGGAWKLLGWEDKAEACWREAIRLDPKFGLAHFHLGMLLLERAIVADAVQTGRQSREGIGEGARVLLSGARTELERAAVLFGTGEDEISKELLRVATAYVAEDPQGVLELAETAVERFSDGRGCERFHVLASFAQEGDARLKCLDRALRVCPRDAFAALLRGVNRKATGNLNGAIADFDQALAVNPRYAEAFRNRADARSDKGDFDGAIADYDEAIAISPRDAEVLNNRGLARLDKGDFDGAIGDFDQALAINPRAVEALNNRGNARREKGDFDGAIADFDQALSINPQNAGAFNNRGAARHAKGDIDGAIADVDQAIVINPRCADAFYNRGILRQARGDLDGAIVDYDQAIAINPRFAPALENRGVLRAAKGDLDDATDDFNEALRIEPRSPNPYYSLACLYALRSVGKAGAKTEGQAVSPQDASRHRDSAFDHLSKAIDFGWSEGGHLRTDADLAPLHDDPRWEELLKRLPK